MFFEGIQHLPTENILRHSGVAESDGSGPAFEITVRSRSRWPVR